LDVDVPSRGVGSGRVSAQRKPQPSAAAYVRPAFHVTKGALLR
jgi:hypothetical protein